MANAYIRDLYRKVYHKEFCYSDFSNRLKMQKCVYLAEQFGLNIGDYSFFWYKHGPYSQRLQDDMYEESGREEETVRYSSYAEAIVEKIASLIQRRPKDTYDEDKWVECLASLLYLNDCYGGDEQKVLSTLKSRKPHLNNDVTNMYAYQLVTQ